MAGVSGFEPKLTESKSVVLPLHYTPTKNWWKGVESNHRHMDFQSIALPTELPIQINLLQSPIKFLTNKKGTLRCLFLFRLSL